MLHFYIKEFKENEYTCKADNCKFICLTNKLGYGEKVFFFFLFEFTASQKGLCVHL